MTHASLSRRSAMAAVAAAFVPAAGTRAFGQPIPPGLRFSSVSVDSSPLSAIGGSGMRPIVDRSLGEALHAAFADRMGGPYRLIVRVEMIYLSMYAGDGGTREAPAGGASTDTLTGTAVVLGPNGAPVLSYPMHNAVPSSSGGAWYDPQSETRRVFAVTRHYAFWLRRQIAA